MSAGTALASIYMTPCQAAQLLNVNRLTIRRWVQHGKLRGERIGNITLILQEDVFKERYGKK